MQKSARLLGQECGLTAEEMNALLKHQGFLNGDPGSYEPTDKARHFLVEKNYHRGNGGYSQYNRYWSTYTYDDSIMEELDLSPVVLAQVKEEVAKRRARRFRQSYEKEVDIEEDAYTYTSQKHNLLSDLLKYFLPIAGGIIYGVFRSENKRH